MYTTLERTGKGRGTRAHRSMGIVQRNRGLRAAGETNGGERGTTHHGYGDRTREPGRSAINGNGCPELDLFRSAYEIMHECGARERERERKDSSGSFGMDREKGTMVEAAATAGHDLTDVKTK